MGILSIITYKKALKLDSDVLKPSLSSELKYNRKMHFTLFDPWVSILPHWTIEYYETPTDIKSISPSITVNLLGGVDGSSKEVLIKLVDLGYRNQ